MKKGHSDSLHGNMDFVDRLGQIAKRVDQAYGAVMTLHDRFTGHRGDNEVRLLLEAVMCDLDNVRHLSEELCSGLACKLVAGEKLTRDEYYLIKSRNYMIVPSAKEMGLAKFDDYEVFLFLCYEDDHRFGYIDVTCHSPISPESDGSERIALRFGFPPEDLDEVSLRPDQRRFFKKYFPSIYKRFGRKQ